jgi:hypothetical protein
LRHHIAYPASRFIFPKIQPTTKDSAFTIDHISSSENKTPFIYSFPNSSQSARFIREIISVKCLPMIIKKYELKKRELPIKIIQQFF